MVPANSLVVNGQPAIFDHNNGSFFYILTYLGLVMGVSLELASVFINFVNF